MTQPHDPNQPEPQQPTERFDAPAPPAFAPPPPAQQPPTRPSWFSGTRRTAIVTGVAGLVIGGVIGGSIGWAATGNDDSAHTGSAYSRQMSTGEGGQNGAAPAKRHARGAVAGTITAINGSSWTVSGRGGRTLTVTVGQNTTFGTKKTPAQQSDFRVGDRVAVVGKDVSGTIEATRVAKRTTPAAQSTAPSASATPGATSQPG
ncbi:DUF5666 domain-containing protein [Williamsia sp. MIQD14]|uniref:DUF5666 domain-containing protein n=1 Tax=Williamsia sp. MIQD14 TaxID=3425703 RepID=UPI003DA0B1F5